MAVISRLPAALTMAAALSMVATPAVAADLPMPAATSAIPADAAWDASSEDAQRHRNRRYRRNRGVDAGDVVAGVVIFSAIAAIANAASRSNERARYRDQRYRTRDDRAEYQRENARQSDNRGLDNAVNMCMRRIERDVRVDNVDNVSRNGEGWNVSGSLYNGEGFSCRIGNDGQVSEIIFGGRSVANTQDRQWSDDRYIQARNEIDYSSVQDTARESAQDAAARNAYRVEPAPVQTAQTSVVQGQTVYPGGPVEGTDNRPVWSGSE